MGMAEKALVNKGCIMGMLAQGQAVCQRPSPFSNNFGKGPGSPPLASLLM